MTFDPFANQGDTSAWDPESVAAIKRAADKIFHGQPDDETADEDATAEAENPSGEGDSTAIKQDPHPASEVPDPDLTHDQ